MQLVLLTQNENYIENILPRCSYIVSIGLVDILARRCMKVREAVENHQCVVLSLLGTLGLLTKIGELCPKGKLFVFYLHIVHCLDFKYQFVRKSKL